MLLCLKVLEGDFLCSNHLYPYFVGGHRTDNSNGELRIIYSTPCLADFAPVVQRAHRRSRKNVVTLPPPWNAGIDTTPSDSMDWEEFLDLIPKCNSWTSISDDHAGKSSIAR